MVTSLPYPTTAGADWHRIEAASGCVGQWPPAAAQESVTLRAFLSCVGSIRRVSDRSRWAGDGNPVVAVEPALHH